MTLTEKIIELLPEIGGRHIFEVGHARCKFCNVEKVVRDEQHKNIVVDEDSSGSARLVTVTEHRMEGGPCPMNPRRPITLADVLRAIDKVETHVVDDTGYEKIDVLPTFLAIDAIGSLWDTQSHKLLKIRFWNLSIDLDGQSPECKAFLEKILL